MWCMSRNDGFIYDSIKDKASGLLSCARKEEERKEERKKGRNSSAFAGFGGFENQLPAGVVLVFGCAL